MITIGKRKLFGMIMLIAAGLMLSGCTNKINLIDYVSVETIGVNERGIAQITLDEDALAQDLITAGKFNAESAEDREIIQSYISRVSYEAIPSNGLKNGDSIVLKASFTNDNNDLIRITEGEAQLKVDGLPGGEKIDIFEYIDLDITGISPNASATILNNGHDKFFKSFKFEMSKTQGLANGEEIEVKVLYDPYIAAQEQYYVLEDTKKLTVEGADAYVLSADEITDEIIAFYEEDGRKVLNQFVKTQILVNGEDYEIELDKPVISTIKNQDEILEGRNANNIAFLYTIRGQAEIYAAVYYNNLIKDANNIIDPSRATGNVGIWDRDKAAVEKFVIEDAAHKYDVKLIE